MDEVVDPLAQVQLPALLGEVADPDGGTKFHRAGVGPEGPRQHMQQGRLARAVAAHDADPVTAQEVVGETVDDGFSVEGLGNAVELDDLPAQTAGSRGELEHIVRLGRVLVQQVLVALDPILGFGGPGLAAPHDPLPLGSEDRLPLALAGLGHLGAQLLQLQILGVIRFIVVQLPPAQLRDLVHHPLEEVAVVGDHDDAAPEGAQPLLQPGHHLAVQVVRRLVQDQDVRRMDQSADQCHPLALTAGEGAHLLVEIGQAQLGQHGFRLVFAQIPEFLRKVEKHLLQDRGGVLHDGILGEIADLDIGIAGDAPRVRLDHPRQDLQEGGLSGAVDADDTGLFALLQIEIHILQQLPGAEIDG